MYADLQDKIAVVTGAATGIGSAIARRFGQEKMAVVVNYHRQAEAAQKVVDQIEASGGRAVAVKADISTEAGNQKLLTATQEHFGGLDVWVNNAGLEIKQATHEVSLADWQKVLDVNQTGTFLGARSALQYFRDHQQAGNIINLSSVHEQIPWPTFASYAAAKGAVKLFTQTIAMEYAADQIRVNALGPGAISTPINAEKLADPKQYQQTVAMIPMKRVGKPEEVAAGAAWLASAESSYVTGITLFIDGGMTLYPSFKNGEG
ncbi:glucose-1-dehydrogenase [Lactobacillus sp. DCY120]|uniref:Glucose-1-dehydrogenase n=1 Tax=Bombilactobacillus apium TaxID=2675299 RepID=A0A850R2Z5_9LACO|nr:glucose-1-dehydrogenase [Bombilactobacillus apium]NVY96730.1 glucose-1-dehydrogenase [Bombilactobacillus apium]